MVKHGYTWLYKGIHCNTGLDIALHGYTWGIHGNTWLYMGIHIWQYTAIHGITWLYMAIYAMAIHGNI